GASGYLGQTRYKNLGPIQHFLKPLRENLLPIVETEELTRLNQIEEVLFLGLRKKVGISTQKFQQKFHEPIQAINGEVIQRL
ncbi:oxygen-independent coproporphyrinogen III oxidase, partial [Enterococcus faecalis]